jgi:alpha-D-xyloside xylohydrolase
VASLKARSRRPRRGWPRQRQLRPFVNRSFTGLALAATAMLTNWGTAAGPSGITVRVQATPFGVSILRGDRVVVREAAGARLRFEVAPDDYEYSLTHLMSSHGTTYRVATSERGRTATVRVRPTTTGAEIAVSFYPARDVTEIYDAFDTGAGQHFLGGGEQGNAVDLSGQIVPLKVDDDCSYAPIPFFASSAGWGISLATNDVAAFAFPGSAGGEGCQTTRSPTCDFPALTDRAEVCVQAARLEESIYVGSLPKTLADYESVTGLPAVPPPDELALIKWRDVYAGPGQVLQDITKLKAARIPIGWVELDNPWEACNGELSFNRSQFPNPAGLIAAVHRLGVKFMLWVSPRATCAQGYPGKPLGPPGSQVLDLRDPAVVAEFRKRLRALVALGVDGMKADRGDEVDLEPVEAGLTNRYPFLYARAVIGALPRGAAAIFRAGTVGSTSVVPGLWAGDQPQAFIGLQRAIVSGQTAAMSGFPTWGSDVGGYAGPPFDNTDVFIRWAQLGAVSPVMEVGGTGENATPWTLGTAAMNALRASAMLHYELFPYLYGLLRRRQPVLRPLGYAFPNDPHSWGAPLEFMVGTDLLAAPVTGPGTTPSVYLPPGMWIDLYTGTLVQGGRSAFVRPTPLDQFPFYVRLGSILPFNLRTRTGSWWGVDEQTHPGRAGYLATNGATLDLTGQPRGVQIFVPTGSRPSQVTIDGHTVRWRWDPGPLPGAVVRLHGPVIDGKVALAS